MHKARASKKKEEKKRSADGLRVFTFVLNFCKKKHRERYRSAHISLSVLWFFLTSNDFTLTQLHSVYLSTIIPYFNLAMLPSIINSYISFMHCYTFCIFTFEIWRDMPLRVLSLMAISLDCLWYLGYEFRLWYVGYLFHFIACGKHIYVTWLLGCNLEQVMWSTVKINLDGTYCL